MVVSVDASWELRLLGHPALRCDDGRLIGLPMKAFTIAAHLLLDQPNQQCSRSELAEFLWSDAELDPSADEFAHPVEAHSDRDRRLDNLPLRHRRRNHRAPSRLAALRSIGIPTIARQRGSVERRRGGVPVLWPTDRNARSRLRLTRKLAQESTVAPVADVQGGGAPSLESGDLDTLPKEKEALARRLIEENPNDEAGHRALIQNLCVAGRLRPPALDLR